MRYLMRFSFDGTNYNGYQKQKNKNTVQDNIEYNLSKIFNTDIKINASGRTDAKVHALNQYAHFDISKEIDCSKTKNSLNKLINKDIYIKEVKKVSDKFHARFSVKEKEYIYKINIGEYNPLDINYIYQCNKELNINDMIVASKYLIGTHDFKSLTKCDKDKNDYIRTIYNIEFILENDILVISFKGNGFLRYMVRNMVGLLLEVGFGKKKPTEIENIILAKDRKEAGITAEPMGLYLKNVKY